MSDRAALHRAVDPGRGRRADEGSPAPTPCEDPCGGFGDEARGSRRPFWLGSEGTRRIRPGKLLGPLVDHDRGNPSMRPGRIRLISNGDVDRV